MTLGERSLEREVLALFDRQTELLLPRIRGAGRPAAATLAHTMKGSALGIGAWRVARAAEAVEQAPEAEPCRRDRRARRGHRKASRDRAAVAVALSLPDEIPCGAHWRPRGRPVR